MKSASSTQRVWYLKLPDERECGPFTPEQILDLYEARYISADTLLRKEAEATGVPLFDHPQAAEWLPSRSALRLKRPTETAAADEALPEVDFEEFLMLNRQEVAAIEEADAAASAEAYRYTQQRSLAVAALCFLLALIVLWQPLREAWQASG